MVWYKKDIYIAAVCLLSTRKRPKKPSFQDRLCLEVISYYLRSRGFPHDSALPYMYTVGGRENDFYL